MDNLCDVGRYSYHSDKPAEKVCQFPANMTPSKFWRLIYSWYWYSLQLYILPKVSIRRWDYEKLSSSTYTFITRHLTFSSHPTYINTSTIMLSFYIILATTNVLFLCKLSDYWFSYQQLIPNRKEGDFPPFKLYKFNVASDNAITQRISRNECLS